jgi:hypothetical protein
MKLRRVTVVPRRCGNRDSGPPQRETDIFVNVRAGETVRGVGEELCVHSEECQLLVSRFHCLNDGVGGEKKVQQRGRERTSFRTSSTAFLSSDKFAVLTLTTGFFSSSVRGRIGVQVGEEDQREDVVEGAKTRDAPETAGVVGGAVEEDEEAVEVFFAIDSRGGKQV